MLSGSRSLFSHQDFITSPSVLHAFSRALFRKSYFPTAVTFSLCVRSTFRTEFFGSFKGSLFHCKMCECIYLLQFCKSWTHESMVKIWKWNRKNHGIHRHYRKFSSGTFYKIGFWATKRTKLVMFQLGVSIPTSRSKKWHRTRRHPSDSQGEWCGNHSRTNYRCLDTRTEKIFSETDHLPYSQFSTIFCLRNVSNDHERLRF